MSYMTGAGPDDPLLDEATRGGLGTRRGGG